MPLENALGGLALDSTVSRSFVERMMSRSPASGYTLWLDVTSTSATVIYVAEVLTGTSASTTGFRGIKVTLDSLGNPLGAVTTNMDFIWDDRASVAWSS